MSSNSLNWIELRKEYETTPITPKELAEKYGISPGTVRSRKHREKWDESQKPKPATQRKKNKATQRQGATQRGKGNVAKKGAPKSKKKKREEIQIDTSGLEDSDLSEKQQLFCIQYLKCFNATKAYQRVYGCSYNSALTAGPRLMGNVRIRKQIEHLKDQKFRGALLDVKDVLQKYIDIAFADVTDYLGFGTRDATTKSGKKVQYSYVDLVDSNKVDGTLITEVSQGRDGVKVKLADKMRALDKLSKYFDLFPDKFKRQIESEKLKLAQRRAGEDDEEDAVDDGFLDALNSEAADVWSEGNE